MDASGGLCVNVQHEMFFATSHWKKWETVGIPISLGYPNLVKTNKSEFMGIKLCFPVPVDGHLKPSIFTKRKRAVLRSLRMP